MLTTRDVRRLLPAPRPSRTTPAWSTPTGCRPAGTCGSTSSPSLDGAVDRRRAQRRAAARRATGGSSGRCGRWPTSCWSAHGTAAAEGYRADGAPTPPVGRLRALARAAARPRRSPSSPGGRRWTRRQPGHRRRVPDHAGHLRRRRRRTRRAALAAAGVDVLVCGDDDVDLPLALRPAGRAAASSRCSARAARRCSAPRWPPGVVDELDLTASRRRSSAAATGCCEDAARARSGSSCVQVLEEDGVLFTRYAARPACLTDRHGPARAAAGEADAGQGRRRSCPTGDGCALRAEVGRLPLHRVPRRRRGRARQPQRAAADPLLPRGGRGGQGAACRSGAWSTARSSCPRGDRLRLRGAAAAHPPGRVAGQPAGRADAGVVRRLRPARPRRRVAARRRRSASAGRGWSERWPAPAPPVYVTARHRATPTTAQRWFETFEGAGLDGVVAKPADLPLRPGPAADDQGQARAHRRLRGRRVPLAQERADRRLAAARPLRRRRRRCSTSACAASFPMARRAELVEELAPYRDNALDDHPWQDWANAQVHGRRRAPDARGGQPVEREEGPVLGAAAPRAGRARSRTTSWRDATSVTPAQFLRWRPDRDAAELHATTSSRCRCATTWPRCWTADASATDRGERLRTAAVAAPTLVIMRLHRGRRPSPPACSPSVSLRAGRCPAARRSPGRCRRRPAGAASSRRRPSRRRRRSTGATATSRSSR